MTLIVAMAEVRDLPESVTEVIARGRPQHIPAGWIEQTGGMHLGRGEWMLRLVRATNETRDASPES